VRGEMSSVRNGGSLSVRVYFDCIANYKEKIVSKTSGVGVIV
jgi:hypothetical protein